MSGSDKIEMKGLVDETVSEPNAAMSEAERRRTLKAKGRKALRAHYWFYVFAFILALFIGTYSSQVTTLIKSVRDDVSGNQGGTSTSILRFTDFLGGRFYQESANKYAENLFEQLLRGDKEGAKEEVQNNKNQNAENIKEKNPGSPLGYGLGVLGSVASGLNSGAYYVTGILLLTRVIGSSLWAVIIVGMLVLIFTGFFWFLFTNVYKAILARIYLEGRTYEVLPVKSILFFPRIRKWFHVSWVCAVTSLYHLLWYLTIVGGFIKIYSYSMVPYIIAENPTLSATEAITLSRKMMNGHKLECFKIDLSMIGWYILSLIPITSSVEVFYFGPYRLAVKAEFYTYVRAEAKRKHIENADLLQDEYLFEKPDSKVFRERFPEAAELYDIPTIEVEPLTGVEGFLSKNFGIILHSGEREQKFREQVALQANQREVRDLIEMRCYPTPLHPLHGRVHTKQKSFNFLQNYTIWDIIMIFFIFSMVGWLWEISYHMVEAHEFSNRGVMHGPWLPIYGSGGVLILTICKRFRSRPVAHFLASVVLCGVVEYATAWYLETTHDGTKWWSYDGYFLNLHGRICAEGLFIFGVGGMAMVYLAAPVLSSLMQRIKLQVLIPIALVLVILFTGDMIYSSIHPNTGKGITDYETLGKKESIWVCTAEYEITDGEEHLARSYEYDEFGTRTKITVQYNDGRANVVMTYAIERDKKNRIVKQTIHDEAAGTDRSQDDIYTYSYGEGDLENEVVMLSPTDGSVLFRLTYEYDDKGNETRERREDYDGKLDTDITYEYVYDGARILGQRTYDNLTGGNLSFVIKKEYDENGFLVAVYSGSKENAWTSREFYTNNRDGKAVRVEYYAGESCYEVREFTYDSNGNILTQKNCLEDGTVKAEYRYEYKEITVK